MTADLKYSFDYRTEDEVVSIAILLRLKKCWRYSMIHDTEKAIPMTINKGVVVTVWVVF